MVDPGAATSAREKRMDSYGLLARYDAAVQSLARAVRELVLKE
jgi:hypothetical protein